MPQRQQIEPISTREITCPICGNGLVRVGQDDGFGGSALLEVHCNQCRSSYNSDGTFRALPHQQTLEQYGWLERARENGLPILPPSEKYPNESSVWARNYGAFPPIVAYLAAHGLLEQ